MPILSHKEIESALNNLNGWSGNENGIHKQFVFKDFPSVIAFMQQAVDGIETANHHPEWTNVYNKLDVQLRTHDADNKVTDKDIAIASHLNALHNA